MFPDYKNWEDLRKDLILQNSRNKVDTKDMTSLELVLFLKNPSAAIIGGNFHRGQPKGTLITRRISMY